MILDLHLMFHHWSPHKYVHSDLRKTLWLKHDIILVHTE